MISTPLSGVVTKLFRFCDYSQIVQVKIELGVELRISFGLFFWGARGREHTRHDTHLFSCIFRFKALRSALFEHFLVSLPYSLCAGKVGVTIQISMSFPPVIIITPSEPPLVGSVLSLMLRGFVRFVGLSKRQIGKKKKKVILRNNLSLIYGRV